MTTRDSRDLRTTGVRTATARAETAEDVSDPPSPGCEARPVPPELPSLPYRVKRLSLLVGQHVDRALKEHGLGRSQWQVLSCLAGVGELSQRQLQSSLLVEPATLTAIVDVLVDKGWAERAEGAPDRRVRMVKMTPAGKHRFSAIDNPIDRVAALMLEGVSDAERQRFSRTMARMVGNLERENSGRCQPRPGDIPDRAKD